MSLTFIQYSEFDNLMQNLNWNQPNPCWLSSQACAFEHLRRIGITKLPILKLRLVWLEENQA